MSLEIFWLEECDGVLMELVGDMPKVYTIVTSPTIGAFLCPNAYVDGVVSVVCWRFDGSCGSGVTYADGGICINGHQKPELPSFLLLTCFNLSNVDENL